MNRKGTGKLLIFGIPLGAIIYFVLEFIMISAATDVAFDVATETLGADYVCPEELENEMNKVCFNSEGEVVANGIFNENLRLEIDSLHNSCTISTGNYDFEYIGCKLNSFNKLTAYNLVAISKSGRITVKGTNVVAQMTESSRIVKVLPKNIKLLSKIRYFFRFL